MKLKLSAIVILIVFGSAPGADIPGLAVAGSEPQAAQQAGSISVAAGRFVPLAVASGKPSLLLGNEPGLVELFPVTATTVVVGIRFDEPAGAKAKKYTFAAGVSHIAIAGEFGGTVHLKAIVNGATSGDAPTVAGELVLTLTGPMPPPGPVPPGPNPPPVDDFAKALRAAYAADSAPDKRERLRAFTDVMTNSATAAGNLGFKTNAEFTAAISKTTRENIGDSLLGVRKEIGKYLNASMPTEVVQLTPELRAKMKAAYTYIAATLGGIE